MRRGRLGPGGILTVDPEHGLLVGGAVPTSSHGGIRTGLGAESVERCGIGEPLPPPSHSLDARHVLHGYTREELRAVLRPLAQSAHDPVSSMGDDSAIAPLAGRGRPLTSYLSQRFAQVTNPAIDHLRERAVMSVSTILGPRPTRSRPTRRWR